MRLVSSPPDVTRTRFGKWHYKAATFVLWHPNYPHYEFDLERCTNSVEILDALTQFSGKPWFDAEDIGYLVLAVNAILHLQANYCGCGIARTTDPVTAARKQGYRPTRCYSVLVPATRGR